MRGHHKPKQRRELSPMQSLNRRAFLATSAALPAAADPVVRDPGVKIKLGLIAFLEKIRNAFGL